MLAVGPHKGRIVSHRSKMIGDKTAFAIKCDVGREQHEALVFITEKAMGMARRALKVCGFDIDTRELSELDENPVLLAGKEVPLVCELYNGKAQVKIDLDSRAEKAALSSLTRKLREVKKAGADTEDNTEPAEPGSYEPDHGVPF